MGCHCITDTALSLGGDMGKAASPAGRALLAKALKGEAPPSGNNFYVRLFQNNFVPATGSNIGDFTESSFGSYAQASSTYSTTTGPTADGDAQMMLVGGDSFVWDCSGTPQTIYGWYMVDAASGDWLFAENYDTPHVLSLGTRHRLFLSIGITDPV